MVSSTTTDSNGAETVWDQLSRLTKLPHAWGIIGESGSGKHLLIERAAQKFFSTLPLEITDTLSDDFIDQIYAYPQKRLYILDIRKIPQKNQNIVLKLLEEPSDNTYVVVIANNIGSLLPAIKNRLIIYTIKPYLNNVLQDFADKKSIKIDTVYLGTLIRTPGDILKINSLNISLPTIEKLADKIVASMGKASFANMLNIPEKINFKDEYDKLDLTFFLRALYLSYVTSYLRDADSVKFKCINLIGRLQSNLIQDQRLDKQRAFTTLCIDIWRSYHGV